MDKPFKFALPSPNFNKNAKDACKPKPHFLTPSGMSLLPREKQPPPMYGKHGATVPPKYLKQQVVNENPFVAATPPPPPPEKQYCEPCELELHSLEDLKRHRAQHEKCPVAGCLYKGHPSVMDKHINALHASGLFDKFKKLSTPEEIAAWRAERRKRYPTLANVLLKQKAQEQRQKRGERLEANKNRFGKVNDRKRAQPHTQEDKSSVDEKKPREESKPNPKNKKNRKNKRNQKNQETKPKVQNDDIKQIEEKKEEESEFTCCGIKMFGGTSQLKNYKHFSDKKKAVPSNALFGLLGMYGSDDDDDNEESEDNESIIEDSEINIETVKVIEEKNSTSDNRSLETNCDITESNVILETENENGNFENSSLINETTKEDSSLIANNSKDDDEVQLATTDINKLITDSKDELNENTIKNLNENSSDEAPEETPIERSMPDYTVKPLNNPKNPFTDEPAEKRSKIKDRSNMR